MFLIIARRCTKGSLKGLSHKKGVVFSLPWAQYCTSQHSESLRGALLGEVMQDVSPRNQSHNNHCPILENSKYQQSFRKVVQGNLLIMGKKRQLCLSRTVLLNGFSLVSLITLMLTRSLWPRVICWVQIGGICSKSPYIPLNSSRNISLISMHFGATKR